MEPKSGLEIALNPEFLVLMPIALIIDIIGIVLVLFGLDDFGITDIIAWFFIGGWGLIRGQIIPAPGAEPIDISSMRKGNFQQLQKARRISEETKKSQKTAKAAKWAKRLKWLEFIPYVGALPLWSVSVYMTIKYS